MKKESESVWPFVRGEDLVLVNRLKEINKLFKEINDKWDEKRILNYSNV